MSALLEKFDSGPIKKNFGKCEHSFILFDSFDNRNVAEVEVDSFGDTLVCQRCLLTVKRAEVSNLNLAYKSTFKAKPQS